MKIRKDENLALHTTIKIGGIAEEYIIPETTEELVNVISKAVDIFLGGGSNLLIAERRYDRVVDLSEFDTSIENLGEGRYKVGAAARLQSVINKINAEGRGGIEYLMSVPGLVGGAVVMNAGRGRQYNTSISDFIISVDVLTNGIIKTFTKEECMFGYRNSIFKNSKVIITSVVFQFPKMSLEESGKLKKERIELCRNVQDNSAPNFGSVFYECNSAIMKWVKFLGISNNKVSFSKKTGNWLLNKGGTYNDVMACIRKVELLHSILKKECKREVIVID